MRWGILAVLAGLATPALAHDWYPVECCHSMDCAPVTSQSFVAGANYDAMGNSIAAGSPMWIVTTKIGTAVVPENLPRRESKDNQMHACIRNTAQGSYVMCIFVPPGM